LLGLAKQSVPINNEKSSRLHLHRMRDFAGLGLGLKIPLPASPTWLLP
jgi:hypothetical protein